MSQTMNVSMAAYTQAATLYCSQYDVGRVITVNLLDESGDYTIPSGATVVIEATKPSGYGFSESCTWSGSTVTITLTSTMTEEGGRFPAELKVTSGTTVLCSANFLMKVEDSPHLENVTDGDAETAQALTLRVTALETQVATNTSAIGTLSDLDTTEQGSLVGAVNELKSDLSEVDTALRIVEPTNKFNPDTATEGYSIGTSGNPISSSSNFTSDFIACSGGDVFYYTYSSTSFYGISSANVSHFAQYDSDKNFISGTRQTYVNSVTLEDDCAYIRFSNPLSHLQDSTRVLSVTFNSYPTAYSEVEEYYEPYIYLTADRFDEHLEEFEDYKSEVATLVRPENELNLDDITENTLISSDGSTTTNSTCFTTNYYIEASQGDIVTYAASLDGTFYHTAVKFIRVVEYDSDKNFLVASSLYVQDYEVQNESTAYIRVCPPNGALTADIASVTINAIPTRASLTEYVEPYYSATKPTQDTIRNRRVLWLGTSIPTYGYPQILARLCGANMHNKAIGSSGIAKGITPNITTANVCGIRSIWGLYGLTQTVAEKETMIANWSTIAEEIGDSTELTDSIEEIALASSYETIVDPYLTGDDAVSLIVLNHAYNDSTEYAIADSGEELEPYTLEGAYNWLIQHILETNPLIGIVIFGHYTDLPDSKETALQNVADRWNIPYYLLKDDLQWSTVQTINTTQQVDSSGEWETITATDLTVSKMWLGDDIHPLGVASKRIAQVSQPVFANWLKMYCDSID